MSGRRDDTSCLLVLFVLITMVVLRVAFEYLNLIASIKVELCASSFPCDYVRVKTGNALPTKLFRPVLCGDGFIEMITGSGFFTCSLPEEVLLTISVHAAVAILYLQVQFLL